MTWFVALVAFVALVVLGLWLPILWVGAAVLLALLVLFGIGLARSREPGEMEGFEERRSHRGAVEESPPRR